ncbi:MAG: HEPN domain-containing protein [Patescibacteria group bacterium]|jgi:HEPN domain-containing protein
MNANILPIIVQEWLDKANNDELNAQSILKHKDGTPSGVCFLSQQMAEKYLKAFLMFHKKPLQKIHALDRLLESCIEINNDLSTLKDDVIFLTDFYISTRYPADIPDSSWNDAEHALTAAKHVKDVIIKTLALSASSEI